MRVGKKVIGEVINGEMKEREDDETYICSFLPKMASFFDRRSRHGIFTTKLSNMHHPW
jgi:hypothetical protein